MHIPVATFIENNNIDLKEIIACKFILHDYGNEYLVHVESVAA